MAGIAITRKASPCPTPSRSCPCRPTRPPRINSDLNPVENVWADLRANKLAFTVFDSYHDIVTACCSAWNFFATDPKAIASITSRTWAEVK